ncbi:bifunctional metallophosphatase/5'-nucleotidase [Planococcus lenghuensis]|uniref:Bifunctional metallophosphatase/5'-nucleotidase n=1 Tax=Planococcus lenghuensis TaxID=2213202 RepID=A0A1Q2L166_9BACL|nr:5'-nucleotidase C-terminal domain-containing protein [Planococcus lenghuensis]AQQ54171.1 bifunctional metallophosphatase/5'-nucleotidase [Planococcus lenghuensis]
MKNNGKQKINVIASTAAALGLLVTSVAPGVAEAKPGRDAEVSNRGIEVQLLGVNDWHGQIDVTRKVAGRYVGGAEYLAAYLKQREAENKNTLLIHSGDMTGGSSPASALLQDEPTIEIMNALGFDIGTLGNHEFDRGVDELNRLLFGGYHETTGEFEGAGFPYIAANVVYKNSGENLLPAYQIQKVNGMDIGFIGVVTEDIREVVIASALENIEVTDSTEAIDKAVAELKAQGVESIVVLAHAPASSNTDGTNATGEAVELANSIDDEVDIILGAHNHAYSDAIVDNKLVVQAYSYGTAFTDIDLVIDPKTKDIVQKSAEVVTTFHDGIEPDAEVKAMVDQYKENVAPLINRIVGGSQGTITRTGDDSGESPLGNLIADSQRVAMATDFALMNPGGIRASLDAGPITWGELYTIQPFGNYLVSMTYTGEQIKAVLEQQFTESKTTILQVSGLTYTYDKNAAIGNKVTDLRDSAGNEILADQTYTVSVNNFLSTGGDGFTKLLDGADPVVGPVDLDALEAYIIEQGGAIEAPATDRISVK